MDEKYYKYSSITNRTYNIFDCIRILNIKQAAFYIENNVKLMDLIVSKDRYTGESVFVFVFNKNDTRDVYDIWCKRKEEST